MQADVSGILEHEGGRAGWRLPLSAEGTLDAHAKLYLTVRPGAVITLTAGECAAMPLARLASLWKVIDNRCPM